MSAENLPSPSTLDRALSAQAGVTAGTMPVRVIRAELHQRLEQDDRVAVEAPLEFQLHHPAMGLEPVSFGTTMRTPGDDEWLAAGLLYGEGVVNQASDIEAVESSTRRPNVVNVRLHPSVPLELQAAPRRFSAGSSCGVCGTTGLDAAIARAAATRITRRKASICRSCCELPQRMRRDADEIRRHGRHPCVRPVRFAGNARQHRRGCGPPQRLR